MDEKLMSLVDAIAQDRSDLRMKMMWEFDSNSTAIMSSYLYAAAGKRADVEKYVECKRILKKSVSVFSEFRGVAFTLVVTKMTLSKDPQEYIDGAVRVYKKLREVHKFTASPYMVMAALIIYENGGVEKADENIEKLEELYKKMKKEHPLLTGDSDRGFFAMLITSGLNIDAIVEETESCYEAVKKVALSKDAVHSLSQILSIVPKSTDVKAEEVKSLIKGFREAKIPVSKEYGLGAVGALTMLDMSVEDIVKKTAEVDAYLKKKKGFKWYSIPARMRHMYSQMIVAIGCLADSADISSTVIVNAITNVIIEEIIMMIIVTQAATSAANSSSGSSTS